MNQERTFQDITRVVSIYRGLSIKFEAYGKYKLLQNIVYSYEVSNLLFGNIQRKFKGSF